MHVRNRKIFFFSINVWTCPKCGINKFITCLLHKDIIVASILCFFLVPIEASASYWLEAHFKGHFPIVHQNPDHVAWECILRSLWLHGELYDYSVRANKQIWDSVVDWNAQQLNSSKEQTTLSLISKNSTCKAKHKTKLENRATSLTDQRSMHKT